MSFRSSSSSPDILGPPGDVEYLVSSPFKPFPGRQSVMSPANFKLLQTPRFAKRRGSRINLSPAKSSHSIRFDDVVLPGSPSRKLNGRQRSLSPEKVQPDGNVSPWRIRVTLEATQDEEMNQGSPSRKRPRNSTMTTKVPLKDEADTMEQTPRKRRGRPRKSDTLVQSATPNGGSPGHTPGPGGASAQKRKRGRPRKYLPESDAVDNVADQVAISQVDEPSVVEPEPSWAPLNLAADGESDDGLPDDQGYAEPFEGEAQIEQFDDNPQNQSPRVEYERTYDTPNLDFMDDVYMQNDENIHSTPSKMPSPSHESQIISPDNTIYAGRTPRPPRQYPTPKSSSLVDEERQDRGAQNSVSRNRFRQSGVHATNDPTDEHREFDSIMESEGFSMVSLDTLPSAKQHGLSASSQVAKGALKPFLERESNGVLRRKSSIRNQANEEDAGLITQPEPSALAQETATVDYRSARAYSSPPSPAPVPVQTSSRRRRRPIARFVRLVRVGIALESALRRPYDRGYPRGLLSSPEIRVSQDQMSSLETSRKRLELLFSEFDSEIQRDLQSGLKFGQELAKRRVQAEIENARKVPEMETIAETTPKGLSEASGSREPSQESDELRDYDTPGTEMRRRMEEWQREREAISREIQLANSSQVIVIDSDVSGPPSPEGGLAAPEADEERDWTSDIDRGDADALSVHGRPEDDHFSEQEEEDEDDGYEDIWQQEANDRGDLSDRSSVSYRHQSLDNNNRQESSPQTNSSISERSAIDKSYSPAYWTNAHDKVPFLGKSRIKELREQDVDISALLRPGATPKRSRYYYGQSSPPSTENGRDPEQPQPTAVPHSEEAQEDEYEGEEVQGVMQDEEDHLLEPPQSEDYLESSPQRAPGEETFQLDPTTNFENARQHSDLWLEGYGDENLSDAASPEPQTAHETPVLTPERPQPSSTGKQASSWLQKITNLTPQWLKVPKRRSFAEPALSVYDEASEDEDDDRSHSRNVEENYMEEAPRPHRDHEQQSFSSPLDDKSPNVEAKDDTYDRPLPLAVSGYFSDDHYILLRRLYRLAKRHPERFIYYPGPGRSDIIGDWIWTSDGLHGVPITERQFAIIDRFVQELAKADLQAGGTGQVGWTEADLHRRLISVIIGEQVREEMKAQLRDEQSTAGHSRRRRAPTSSWY
ncbi:hypothetical protein P875_00021506 [Aspergillus parasiticus SU-1]|uniref:AT DNA binding protein n=1 Tax=Aspergillus parasiticus (strain ATCC 56775 / NRRL 5862 / SRRC 143 / SU-1) TaxID=1403190 RepID=A0A0F0IF78_ASPPU|nr:hypothetical protein P875_00021506 [Aspergillus parasiticus SU-1]